MKRCHEKTSFTIHHNYFGTVWKKLDISKKIKILDITASGKSIFPYEKIISSDSLDIKPSGQIFDRI